MRNVAFNIVVSALTCLVIHGIIESKGRFEQYTSRALANLSVQPVGNAPEVWYRGNAHLPVQINHVTGFVDAAKAAYTTVVHIKARTSAVTSPFDEIFGEEAGPDSSPVPGSRENSGSGVIVRDDGYIVTNSHVVGNSKHVEISMHDKTNYVAKVVGIDAATDLAILKIEARNLPAISFGNSDSLEVGEWVLAVGNPFNLTSTVTAGIVSAKARDINILQDEMDAIESFIQTDAAVNPGNSGGALVNTKGQLVGINTAIATRSGSYAGYSFAVPVSIVHKVMNDIITYGTVQRAYLGVTTRDVTTSIAQRLKLPNMNGVWVEAVVPGSSGDGANLQRDDVILEVHGYPVNDVPELTERIAQFRPGDRVAFTYWRKGKQQNVTIVLNSQQQSGVKAPVSSEKQILEFLGAEFEEVAASDLQRLGLLGGVRVTKLVPNGLFAQKSTISEGYIIYKINNTMIRKLSDLYNFIRNTPSGTSVHIEGKSPNHRTSTTHALVLDK